MNQLSQALKRHPFAISAVVGGIVGAAGLAAIAIVRRMRKK